MANREAQATPSFAAWRAAAPGEFAGSGYGEWIVREPAHECPQSFSRSGALALAFELIK